MKLTARGKYWYKGQVFRKGDVFDVDSVAFVPYLMQDMTPPKPIVAVKVEAPKEEKPKADKMKKTGITT
ncbi:hypothetical protein MUP79_05385 [Candidatus Bathyarchaeota archaeon]|nr:hypothetical protein [Candidatus Bathyarchaeota archaeon]